MTIFGFEAGPALIWVILAVILFIVEALTMGLTSIWFAIGAIGGAVAAMAGGGTIVQICVFLGLSLILAVVTRPIAKKRFNSRTVRTNVDALRGQEAFVTEDIHPGRPGAVKADGKVWTAVCGEDVLRDEKVIIRGVEGVKLLVDRKEDR